MASQLNGLLRPAQDLAHRELKRLPHRAALCPLDTGRDRYDPAFGGLRDLLASQDTRIERGHRFITECKVDYQLWNRLIGVTNPERLSQR